MTNPPNTNPITGRLDYYHNSYHIPGLWSLAVLQLLDQRQYEAIEHLLWKHSHLGTVHIKYMIHPCDISIDFDHCRLLKDESKFRIHANLSLPPL